MVDPGAPSKVQVAVADRKLALALLRTVAGGVQASSFDGDETVLRMAIADTFAGLL